eukprot:TRINITY_DN21544_c0_g1_i3.p1 TRINITY_DN21544_c0_g1~~TRINITY_DN21544_c0_g1_i3.p1  ORF type:complete len:188 (-),score=40.81 TRINITY_DN21544_c0_g1_i3:183-716(-)
MAGAKLKQKGKTATSDGTVASTETAQELKRASWIPPSGTGKFCCLVVLTCIVPVICTGVAAVVIGLQALRSGTAGTAGNAAVESVKGAPNNDFAVVVTPMVRSFIASHYTEYGRGEVTLKQLKKHIVAKSGLDLTYEDLRDDRYSAVIEDEVDAIVGRCDGGQKPVSCVGTAVGSEL